MKTVAALLFVPMLALVAAMGWVMANYTVITSASGDEWLIVTNARAVACKQPGGCAVLTASEAAVLMRMIGLRLQHGGGNSL